MQQDIVNNWKKFPVAKDEKTEASNKVESDYNPT